jgi:hypothetical protein
MASLLSSLEISGITGIFEDIFDTFKRTIVIHKEPVKTISQINTENLFGYGDSSNTVNYTYAPQSGSYFAKISYVEKSSEDPYVRDLGTRIDSNIVRIKVKDDVRSYIQKGKTEKITFDDKTFQIAGNEIVKNFLGSEFYIYYLKETA